MQWNNNNFQHCMNFGLVVCLEFCWLNTPFYFGSWRRLHITDTAGIVEEMKVDEKVYIIGAYDMCLAITKTTPNTIAIKLCFVGCRFQHRNREICL